MNEHSKCPLCGGNPMKFGVIGRPCASKYGCPKCEFTTFSGDCLDWNAWEELVAKFPPVIRKVERTCENCLYRDVNPEIDCICSICLKKVASFEAPPFSRLTPRKDIF